MNHLSRVIAAPRHRLFGRLHIALHQAATALKRWYLTWLLYSLGQQLDEVEAALQNTAIAAHGASQRHRVSPRLNAQRRNLRRQAATLGERMLAVRRELDNLLVRA